MWETHSILRRGSLAFVEKGLCSCMGNFMLNFLFYDRLNFVRIFKLYNEDVFEKKEL